MLAAVSEPERFQACATNQRHGESQEQRVNHLHQFQAAEPVQLVERYLPAPAGIAQGLAGHRVGKAIVIDEPALGHDEPAAGQVVPQIGLVIAIERGGDDHQQRGEEESYQPVIG